MRRGCHGGGAVDKEELLWWCDGGQGGVVTVVRWTRRSWRGCYGGAVEKEELLWWCGSGQAGAVMVVANLNEKTPYYPAPCFGRVASQPQPGNLQRKQR
ncbi:hypothetical protein RIF29_00445 [Crotalaria pallida]|uniref:Uncharacterized protein n=1 Tax=Crotalaria pallida TaxID=3830 RepID=A0AAN9IWI1_CROPI